MATLTEGVRAGDVVLYEAPQAYSRAVVTIASGADLVPGAVLGRITANGKYILSAPAAEDGSQTPVAVLLTKANAAAGDVTGAIALVRHSKVVRARLVFDSTINNSTKRTTAVNALAAVGIVSDR